MNSSRFESHPVLTAIGISVLGAICLLVGIEVSVHLLFPQINFRDADARLLVERAFHQAHGNAKNFTGKVFGVTVTTDGNGFRVDAKPRPSLNEAGRPQSTVVFLGDSVTFGVGVVDGRIFADRVREKLPGVNVMNASSIGYFLESYERVVRAFVVPNKQRLGIRKIVLGICLNDVSTITEQEFVAARNGQEPHPPNQDMPDPTTERDGAKQLKTVVSLLGDVFPAVNRYLRSRSKSFLLLKSLVLDSRRGTFLADLTAYDDPQAVERSAGALGSLAAELRQADIELIALIFPYEYQLRVHEPAIFLPQQVLGKLLRAHQIRFFDLAGEFQRDIARSGRRSGDYFLFDDPMHLSALGHEVVASFALRNGVGALSKISSRPM
jgi:lysophospholipase L1-like esterase